MKFFDLPRLLRTIDDGEGEGRRAEDGYDESDDDEDVVLHTSEDSQTDIPTPSAVLPLFDSEDIDTGSSELEEVLADAPIMRRLSKKEILITIPDETHDAEHIGGTFELGEWV